MRSSQLIGFGAWQQFNRSGERALMLNLPNRPGVYAIRHCKDYPRRIGSSDILYFGSATNQQGLKHDSGSTSIPARHSGLTCGF